MQFITDAINTLHVSWYGMVFFTVLPMAVTIHRSFSLIYLILYALSGAWVVLKGITPAEPSQQYRVIKPLQSRVDEKTRLFRSIKLQDP